MESSFSSYSLSDLKEFCRALKLKQKGNKEAIIKTLIDFLSTPGSRQRGEGVLPPNILSAYDLLAQQQPVLGPSDPLLRCICTSARGPAIACSKCGQYQHVLCVGMNARTRPYLCPKCILLKLSPLDFPVEAVLGPWRLKECTDTRVELQKMEFTNHMINTIHSGNGDYQIQIRCTRLDGKSQCMAWPPKGNLIINGKIAMKFTIPDNPNAKKRKDEPLNITTIVKPGENTIGISVMNDKQAYAVVVFLIFKKTEQALIEEIKNYNLLSVKDSKIFIMRTLSAGDEEVQSNSIKFTLKCPLSMQNLRIPARGTHCPHIQCFDLENYVALQKSSRVNRWKCPICKGFVYEIIVDAFIAQIVENAREVYQAYGVEIFRNAEYKILNSDSFIQRSQMNDSIPDRRPSSSPSLPPVKIKRVEDIIEID